MWKSAQCAVRGRSHVKTGLPCQDKTYAVCDNGVDVIALADGAGSAALSHIGAETVTAFICRELTEKFDAYFSKENGAQAKRCLVEGIAECLAQTASAVSCDVKDLASTLLVAAVKDERFILAHIGDGVIGYLKHGEMRIASQPSNGEFTNTTVFTTSADALATMTIIKGTVGEIEGFVLMSDGTETGLYNKREKRLSDALKRMMCLIHILPAETVEEDLRRSFQTVLSNVTADDCSIIFLVNERSGGGYLLFDHERKCDLLMLRNDAASKRWIDRYDRILCYLETPRSLSAVARHIRIKPRYAKKHLHRLLRAKLIVQNGPFFQTEATLLV